mgnify:CR=1 FL=1
MAGKATATAVRDGITAVVTHGKDELKEPRVCVILPLIEAQGSDVKVDQTENVTINGVTTQIRRGEYADVTVPVFIQLKNRYPNL